MPLRWSCLVCLTAALPALEGGYPSSHQDWQGVKPRGTVSKEERAEELESRTKAIEAEIARLKARLKKVPPAAKMKELSAKLQAIHDNYGWEPRSKMVYGRRCIEPMLKGQDALPEKLMAAFVQFNDDLKARGIDLIVMPLVPTPHFHAHTLVDGIEAEHEYFPGWTAMMIAMLENDIEVIDSVDEFRQEATNEVLVSWANDFHTGSLGRQLAARKLAERLQRYDFARDLKANRSKWTVAVKEKTGASLPQRILVVNGGMMSNSEYWMQRDKSLKRWEAKKKSFPAGMMVFKGKRTMAPRPDLPKDCIPGLKGLQFKYIDLKGPKDKALLRTEMVMVGDSQLHSAVYGSGLPAVIFAEVGGIFRWGSKSWSGFSPPEIYHKEVCPDSAVRPRVVVMAFLPKYFWHRYDRKGNVDEKSCKYAPKPMPPFKGKIDTPAAEPKGSFTATVQITMMTKKPTEDPSTLDYDEALMHIAAKGLDGPIKGKTIGLRYWILRDGKWTRADQAVKRGDKLKLTLVDWDEIIKREKGLSRHQIFNDTEQGFTVPWYFVTGGKLAVDR